MFDKSLEKIRNFSRILLFLINDKLPGTGTKILLYHSISKRLSDPHHLSVSPSNFADQLRLLRKYFMPISAEVFYHALINNISLPGTILLTFDDGNYDNLANALPIMEKYNVPGLFFINTFYLGKKSYIWDNLPSNQNEIKRISSNLQREKITLSQQEVRPLTKVELKNFSKSRLVTIGGHTHTHPQLSSLSMKQQSIEIKRNDLELKRIIGKKPDFFSYPFGYLDDYDRNSLDLVRENYKLAFTTVPGIASRHSDPYQLPRIGIRNQPLNSFQSLLNG